jgi:hypothetical protein
MGGLYFRIYVHYLHSSSMALHLELRDGRCKGKSSSSEAKARENGCSLGAGSLALALVRAVLACEHVNK